MINRNKVVVEFIELLSSNNLGEKATVRFENLYVEAQINIKVFNRC